jgi:hypothetical protein
MPKKKSPRCQGCRTEYSDPIMKNSLSDGESFCTWCGLHRGEPQVFLLLRNIPSPAEDKRILAAETSLQRWAKQKLEDPADFDWYSCFYSGKSYGKKWSDYVVEFVGVPYRSAERLGTPLIHGWLHDVPIYSSSIGHSYSDSLYLCRARIFYRYSWAYLQFAYDRIIPQVDIRNIRHADGEQLQKVQNGTKLFDSLKIEHGPEKGSRLMSREHCLKELEEILATNPRINQEDLAGAFGRAKFFRYRDKYRRFSKQDIERIRQELLYSKRKEL